ncbi:hypothetical protein GLAREA_11512 [Glarea lozoyensis ATCC 20868]|uniref:Cenp-O kinetochore centromere component n=1 Tax=Glarea lozoyensis (strain ATCC 20868 / MF5171) TaxID=1116229 RepID=S3CYM5_GLAL2|nr:uncharacterized protein GLAREA_11512 [Glarea lozoyensis ATCC 20868]EPE24931.1 hypothetical protein GLAREA_11512 [Glarea lozoyensis ATCC 20868]
MDTSIISNEPEDPIGAQLDEEIASLQSQINSLKSNLKLQTSTILSSQATRNTLRRLQKPTQEPRPQSAIPSTIPTDTSPLNSTTTAQTLHNTTNLYRACNSLTTFRIHDPDPHAVDNGSILALRLDISTSSKFIAPYYIVLNKPFPSSPLLRVHRHTLPPYIPLAHLAERYLPHGKGAVAMGSRAPGQKRQDLNKFARALRREVVAYHNRVAVIKGLRREFRLDKKGRGKGKERERVIEDVSAADAEARQVRIEWVDGRIGRAVVGDGGEVIKCVVMGEGGRDWESERAIMGGRMEGVGERLREGIY